MLSTAFLFVLSAKTAKEGERFDRTQWKSMTQTMNDSTKFVDMLHNVSWEDGLPSDVLQGILNYYQGITWHCKVFGQWYAHEYLHPTEPE